MKLKLALSLFIFQFVFTTHYFAQQILDNGKTVYFGQTLQEVQKLFSVTPFDDPSPIARKGVDKKVEIKDVLLSFDTERLSGIEFTKEYQFKTPPKPYSKAWKNFDVIDDKKVIANMSREEFLTYLAAWEERAKKLGAQKVDSEDLNENQYNVSVKKNEFMEMLSVSMGPSRKTNRGGRRADGWCVFFTTETDHKLSGTPVGKLQSISAFCDEFNTVARKTN
jgi:hypothetical protein